MEPSPTTAEPSPSAARGGGGTRIGIQAHPAAGVEGGYAADAPSRWNTSYKHRGMPLGWLSLIPEPATALACDGAHQEQCGPLPCPRAAGQCRGGVGVVCLKISRKCHQNPRKSAQNRLKSSKNTKKSFKMHNLAGTPSTSIGECLSAGCPSSSPTALGSSAHPRSQTCAPPVPPRGRTMSAGGRYF